MPKLDLEAIPLTNSTGYPPPFDAEVQGRWKRRIGPVAGLEHLGASLVVLEPGAWSSQRHWHDGEDELLVMLSGEAVLVEDEGKSVLQPGDVCAWAAGVRNGHHVRNDSAEPCSFIVVSAGASTGGGYSDIDMIFDARDRYLRKDGTEYGTERL